MPPVCVEGSRDVLPHWIQVDYNSLVLAAVALQTVTTWSKTPTSWFSHSMLLVFKNSEASCEKMASVLASHQCSETATASCKKASLSWNWGRNSPWLTSAETCNTGPRLICSLLLNQVSRPVVYSIAIPKMPLTWAKLCWLPNGFLHHSEAINCTWMPTACQRRKVITPKHYAWVGRSEKKGLNHQHDPHKAGCNHLQRKSSIYLLWYFCWIRGN